VWVMGVGCWILEFDAGLWFGMKVLMSDAGLWRGMSVLMIGGSIGILFFLYCFHYINLFILFFQVFYINFFN